MPRTQSMTRLSGTRLSCTLALAALAALAACGDAGDGGEAATGTRRAALVNPGAPADGRYIVVLGAGADPARVANAAGAARLHTYRHALHGFSARLSPAALAHLRGRADVRIIDPDQIVNAIAQTLPTGVDRIDADESTTAAIDGVDQRVDVDVAVIDTGIDLDHPDLNVAGGVHLVKGRNLGGDDDNGHGTHVAGTIAALDNGSGVVGVAPGARLWAVKVLDKNGSGFLSDVIAGVDWVTANAATIEVANMSLGGSGSDDTDGGDCRNSGSSFHLAICNSVHAGVVYAVAAGNAASDASGSTPAAYDEVITVSALADFDGQPGGLGSGSFAFSICTEDVDDSFACFSNFGHDVDVIAPGVGILSTYRGGGTATFSGTSMASPHAAGAAALHVARNGRATDKAGVDAVRQALIDAGDAAPCGAGTACADDPDGVQEPLVDAGDGCASDLDCGDANDCTADTCGTDGRCVHTALADGTACGAGGICCGGACSTPACSADADCDDGSECTTDACASPGTCDAACSHTTVADGTACATGACCGGTCCGDLCCAGACTAPACSADADCADGQTCTTDTCADPGACTASCSSAWPACGASDACCGPDCDGATDPDCSSTVCGNGVCEGNGEDCRSCPADCRCAGRGCAACCGDGVCSGENANNCAVDCG